MTARIDWRIYYADASTFSSDDGSAHEAPAFGVQAICQRDADVGLETLHAFDYYLYMDGRWNGLCGHDGLVDQLSAHAPDIEALKAGRQIPRQQYQDIMRRALHDPDFPRKSATHRGERPR